MQYPNCAGTSDLPPWYRGAPALVKDEHGKERCVACQLCEIHRSPRAITIVPEEIPPSDPWAKVEKRPKEFEIDMIRLHLLRLVRRGVSRAGHLSQKGIFD